MKNSALILLLVVIAQACYLLPSAVKTHVVKAEGLGLKRKCNIRITKAFPIINTPYHASEPTLYYPCCNKTL